MRQPDSYTDHEGGKWLPWPQDLNVNTIKLPDYERGDSIKVAGSNTNILLNKDGPVVKDYANIYQIHSIRWHLAEGLYARWDTINHWTE